jgi:hypothetical protein
MLTLYEHFPPAAILLIHSPALQPPKQSVQLRVYLTIQYILNGILAIAIIAIMALTLAKFAATKNVPGAWPQNPVTSPTIVMLAASVVTCLVDSANLLVQCCGAAIVGFMARFTLKVRHVTGIITMLAPAVAAGYHGVSTTMSPNNSDLWSWACSGAADAMGSVNDAQMVCNTNVSPSNPFPALVPFSASRTAKTDHICTRHSKLPSSSRSSKSSSTS